MNDERTVAELERTLRTMEPEALRPDTLASIRTLGGRRRRARTTVAVAGAAAGVAFASVGLVAALGGDGPQASNVDATGRPSWSSTTLSPLTRRVLTEIPGAVQVSDTQVVIPEPPGATNELAGMEVEDDWVDGARVDVGAHSYRGVTSFAPGAFPAWLYDKVAEYGADDHVAGSIAQGVLVDTGPMQLACVRAPNSADQGTPVTGCIPMLLERANDTWTTAWTMVTDGFLQPGQELQVFSADTYASGAKDTVWIGGTYGTDVASVELVGEDGSTVAATVESGTVSPGNTMFWAHFDGAPAEVVTRDAEGQVLEEHVTQSCEDLGIVDCTVR